MRLDAHDFDRSTTHSLLEGLRSYLGTYDAQLDAVRRDDAAVRANGDHAHLLFFSEVFPRLFGYAYLVQLSLIIEARIAALAKSRGAPHPAGWNRSDAVGRIEAYLTRLTHASPPPHELFEWVVDVMLLRDCIVHAAGRVDAMESGDRSDLEALVRRRPGLGIELDASFYEPVAQPATEHARILRIEREFCVEAVTAVQGLFGHLYHIPVADLH